MLSVWFDDFRLELGGLRRSREGDDVADVGHAGDEEHQTLEACVWALSH